MSPEEDLRRAALFDLDDPSDPPPPAPKKKSKPKSPTARSLAYARDKGWTVAVVEKWNPHARIRQDLFGFADLVVLDDKHGLLAVQATTGPHLGARVEKLSAMGVVRRWLARGLRVECWGWRKTNDRKAGTRKTWALRRLSASEVNGELSWDEVES